MSGFTSSDHGYMARALRLARRGMYTAHPNPRVGCVLVKDGTIVGEGWHRKAGEAHAEIVALEAAGHAAKDSTAYVTLEPCSHHGKTPPCAQALIDAGVAAVIVAMSDPNPKVGGSGIEALEGAGIEVSAGLMRAEAESLNEGFVSRVSRARPLVRLKLASSLDGRTAMLNGESQWISGVDARRDVQRLRASSGAVMTGIATVIADDPSFTVRDRSVDNDGLQPLRIVLDSKLRLPPSSRMLSLPGETIIFCVDDTDRRVLEDAGAAIIKVAADDARPDLAAVMQSLAELKVNDLLVESGPTLAGSLLNEGLVDELVIYQAPHIMGSEARGMVDTPSWRTLQQRMALDIIDLRRVGKDTRITARPAI